MTSKKSVCLYPPTRFVFDSSEFEYAVYSPSVRFSKELEPVFPNMTPKQRKELLVVPVIQKCFHDMSASTPEINRERDEKLDVFVDWGKRVINRLNGLGMWADVMDPASGYPIISPSGALPYPDVQGTIDLMGYETHNVGCCHILLHPKWRSKIYPSTFFTTAPADLLVKVIDEVLEKA